MLTTLLHKVFGSKNDRELKKLRPLVAEINRFEPDFASLSPEALRAKTEEFKSRIQEATGDVRARLEAVRARALSDENREEREQLKEEGDKLETELRQAEAAVLDALLPQAFAAVREASRRTTGMRHFDCQLLGGAVLHQGRIAEMKTGEGKTLVASLPLYLNALLGRGCHLVTPNEYLARVGGGWMGPVYHRLGISVGVIYGPTGQSGEAFSGIYDPGYVDA